jgi:ATP/ADP translocase
MVFAEIRKFLDSYYKTIAGLAGLLTIIWIILNLVLMAGLSQIVKGYFSIQVNMEFVTSYFVIDLIFTMIVLLFVMDRISKLKKEKPTPSEDEVKKEEKKKKKAKVQESTEIDARS